MIIQGMAYDLPISIMDADGNYLDVSLVAKVEFCVGTLRKLYISGGGGDVTYDSETKTFNFPLTEAETMAMTVVVQYQFRVLYTSGVIKASIPESIEVISSMPATSPMS